MQMKDVPLTLPSPNRPPRSKDRKANIELNTSNNSQSNINSVQNLGSPIEMATSRATPFTSNTSPSSFHSPSSIPPQPRHHFPNLKPTHMSPANTEASPANKHIDSYKIQQGQAAAVASASSPDPPSIYALSTRRKVFAVSQKQPHSTTFSSNAGNWENRINQNSSTKTSDNMPHRSLPKPPEIPSAATGAYVATTRGGVAGGPTSYVSRHAKGPTHEINDYSHLKQRVLVGGVWKRSN